MLTHVPTRAEIPTACRWDIESVYPSAAEWEADMRRLQDLLPTIQAWQGRLANGAEHLLGALRLQDEVGQLLERAFVYARMRKDEDTRDNGAAALHDRAYALLTRVQSSFAFLRPEILALPPELLESFLTVEPGLELYRHHLEELVRGRDHIRSAEIEAVLARGGEVAAAPRDIFRMLNDADLEFGTVADEQGEPVPLTHGRYRVLVESQDRRVRRDAFQSLYSVYHKFRNTLAAALTASIKKDVFLAEVRRYPSALHAALDPHNIPVAVYRNLIAAVRAHLPALHHYMGLRKRLLGLDELHMYDIYVPLVQEVERRCSWEEATELVERALYPLGADYVGALAAGLRSRWVDVYENQGKRSGAYSDGGYTTPPFILMNYQERLSDVFTLAHELGHSMHSYYTRMHQPYIYSGYTLFVAEVASTLNEALVTDHLLHQTDSATMQRYLINHELETFRTTLFRQTMFAEFELQVHELVEMGEALSADRLCQIYHQLNADYHGPDMANDPEIAMEWARVPHFYSPFYVYQYATGISAAAALARQILSEGQPAVERYLRFLSRGDSAYSVDLLRDAGVDVTTPQPVEQAIGHFIRRLAELERLSPAH